MASSSSHGDDKRAVRVRDVAGRTLTGELVRLGSRRVAVRGKATKSMAIDDVLRIDRSAAAAARTTANALIYLANGDRLAATPTKIAGDDLHIVWAGPSERVSLKLPLSSVRAILLQRPDDRADAARLESALRIHSARKDLIVFRNGDRATGRLKSLGETAATLSGTTGKIARKDIAAIAFDPQYVETSIPLARGWLAILRDGSRLTAKSVVWREGKLRLETLFGRTVVLPWGALVSLRRISPGVVPLSSLAPATYKYTPFLSGKRTLQIDRNVLGGTLSLRGTDYTVGLGMHSKSRASFAVPRGARHFLALVGIDDAARGRGDAVFAVEVDGKRVFESKALTGKDQPVSVGPISLSGAKRLTLIVDFGPFGDILDYADWCDAVIVKR
ncbi:MAG: NPCBM/NEW2 domain-containing protein [Planctomycetaceae bacterium]